MPSSHEIESALLLVSSDNLTLDDQSRTIRFLRPGMEINLGSIGKGYALDRVAVSIRGRIRTALLNAGASSMCAIGAGEGGAGHSGWIVGLRHPRYKNRRMATIKNSRLCRYQPAAAKSSSLSMTASAMATLSIRDPENLLEV